MLRLRLESRRMKFSNFLFPASLSAADDGRIIDETLREARLTDALGFDTIWLAEHHFDGIVAYVDPVAFAAALASRSPRWHCITRSGWRNRSR
jgi:alkanesulfonate monooxygenase SsuD/methylene tetrahydromethanopterin reductase-like flavin-dependent oxidoreductase (luciferase family)